MRRLITVVLAVFGSLLVLAACDKPLPEVTVSGGGTVLNLSASAYCFDAEHCREPGVSDLRVLKVAPDAKVMVNVPSSLAKSSWQVRALKLSDGGQTELGSSGKLTDSHYYRVTSSVGGGDPFILEVNQLIDGKIAGRWSVIVQLTGSS